MWKNKVKLFFFLRFSIVHRSRIELFRQIRLDLWFNQFNLIMTNYQTKLNYIYLLYNSSANLYLFAIYRTVSWSGGLDRLFIVTDSYGHFLSFLALEVIGLRETTWRILTFFFKVGKRKRRKIEFKRIIIHELNRESNLVYEYYVSISPFYYVINILLRGDSPKILRESFQR